jgi:hypothetical protein
MKVCGAREDAEDTAQETLLRLARQLKEFADARAGPLALQSGQGAMPDEPPQEQIRSHPIAFNKYVLVKNLGVSYNGRQAEIAPVAGATLPLLEGGRGATV